MTGNWAETRPWSGTADAGRARLPRRGAGARSDLRPRTRAIGTGPRVSCLGCGRGWPVPLGLSTGSLRIHVPTWLHEMATIDWQRDPRDVLGQVGQQPTH